MVKSIIIGLKNKKFFILNASVCWQSYFLIILKNSFFIYLYLILK